MIGQKIRKLLEQKGITQTQFAEKMGLSPNRLNNYLADRREPDFATLERMAKGLDVDLNYFSDNFNGGSALTKQKG